MQNALNEKEAGWKKKNEPNKSFKRDTIQMKSIHSLDKPNAWLGTQEKSIDKLEYRYEETI